MEYSLIGMSWEYEIYIWDWGIPAHFKERKQWQMTNALYFTIFKELMKILFQGVTIKWPSWLQQLLYRTYNPLLGRNLFAGSDSWREVLYLSSFFDLTASSSDFIIPRAWLHRTWFHRWYISINYVIWSSGWEISIHFSSFPFLRKPLVPICVIFLVFQFHISKKLSSP